MKNISFRIVKTEGKTKDGHKFPRYYAIYVKNGERAYIDVSFSGNTLGAFSKYLAELQTNYYLDVILPFAEKKEEREKQHAFIAPKRKRNTDGSYSYVTDRKGNRIPHLVITNLDYGDVLPLSKALKLPESKADKEYNVDNFFKDTKSTDDNSDL